MDSYLSKSKGDLFMNNLLKSEMLTYQAGYLSAAEAQETHEGWRTYINKGGIKHADLSACKMEVVANGRLVHLINASGEGGIAIKTGTKQTTVFDIFLHLPQGKDNFEAILINQLQY